MLLALLCKRENGFPLLLSSRGFTGLWGLGLQGNGCMGEGEEGEPAGKVVHDVVGRWCMVLHVL